MTSSAALRAFLSVHRQLALVEVIQALGSTPREQGAWMLVAPFAIFGTIGGGQLEFMAIDRAREMLGISPSPLWAGSARSVGVGVMATPGPPPPPLRGTSPIEGKESRRAYLSIPLGPEIGQCCGGRVEISVTPLDEQGRAQIERRAADEDTRRPHVYLFGGGHVGHALAVALVLLPFHVVVVETRADALDGLPANAVPRLTAVPEEEVRSAPPGSAFVVLTHDHALDFLIVAEALRREDAAYVGMIGSKTKRATFKSWYLREAEGSEQDFGRLVCPIGGDRVSDKRPEVIAAMAAAEILSALLARTR